MLWQIKREMVTNHEPCEKISPLQSSALSLTQKCNLLERIIQEISSLVIVLDRAGKIMQFNHASTNILGYSFEEVRDRYFWDLFLVDPEIQTMQEMFKDLKPSDFPNHYENEWVARDGTLWPIAWSNTVLLDCEEQIEYIICTGMEISERKKAANRAKSAFLANMSHELRTPLNTVIGYSEMLVEDLVEMSHQEIISDVNRIKNAGQHLLKLINNILKFSRIDAGTIEKELELFDVGILLQELSYRIEPLAQSNHNRLKISDNVADLGSMYANRSWVQQVLVHLLSNAAKFTQAGEIQLTAKRSIQDKQEWITFCVSDTGIGISPEQIEDVFDAFSQADFSMTRQYGGTGLGLTISRRLCRMMGGDITVKSQLGKGAVFKVHLPAKVTERYLTTDSALTTTYSDSSSFFHLNF